MAERRATQTSLGGGGSSLPAPSLQSPLYPDTAKPPSNSWPSPCPWAWPRRPWQDQRSHLREQEAEKEACWPLPRVSEALWGPRGNKARHRSPTQRPSDTAVRTPLPASLPQFPGVRGVVPPSAGPADATHLTSHQQYARTCVCTHTTGHFSGGGRCFFVFLFFLCTLQKEGQAPVKLTKELTNITKILQFVRLAPPSQLLCKGEEGPAAGRGASESVSQVYGTV